MLCRFGSLVCCSLVLATAIRVFKLPRGFFVSCGFFVPCPFWFHVITWQISARYGRLEICSDYITNLSPGWQPDIPLKPGSRHLVSLKANYCACPSALFYPGDLAFQPVYPGWNFQTGLKLSSCNRKRRFKKICSRNRAEIRSSPNRALRRRPGKKKKKKMTGNVSRNQRPKLQNNPSYEALN